MSEAMERLVADTFTACQSRGDTTLELMCIEEIARLMAEAKR